MIIGYARVSTVEQNLDLQMKALREGGCEKIYADKRSGSSMVRPEWEKCRKFLSPGDTLVIWKLDRLSRSMLDLVTTVQALFEKNVGFKVVTAPIDTTTAQGRLIFGIFSALAEFERALIKERVIAGVRAAKARGVKFGRPPTITPDVVEMAKALIASEDMSVRAAAHRLGISKSGLYRHL